MKQEELEALQPHNFHYFQEVLHHQRLAHAYLFSGAFASYEMALYLSQALFCEAPSPEALPCQTCRSCRLIESGQFSDVTTIEPQGNVIKTETIRELVKQFSQSGFEQNRQVFIVRSAEKMHINAANSLLKVMEEPQSEVYLFLLTDQEEAVLPTIRSRSQLVSFPKNMDYLVETYEQKGLLKTQARLIAALTPQLEMIPDLATDKSLLETIQWAKKWVNLLTTQPLQAYLQVPVVLKWVEEKKEQERLLQLLVLLAGEKISDPSAQALIEQVEEAQRMWNANVGIQPVLEYLALHM